MSELNNAKAWAATVKGSFEWSSLSDDQLLAVWKIATGNYNFFGLFGSAGSGKSRTTMFAKSVLESLGWEVRVCGTTGVASVNVRGEGTINKMFALGLGDVLPTGLADLDPRGYNIRKNTSKSAVQIKVNSFAGSNSKRPLAIFIDELSMASSEMLYLCYCVIKEAYPNRHIQFIGVGDLRQLLAVPNKDTRWDTFTSLFFEDAKFHPKGDEIYTFPSVLKTQKDWKVFHMSLVTNHRQKTADGWFVDALKALGQGKDFNHTDVAALQSRIWYNKNGKYVSMRGNKELPSLDDAVHFYNTNAQVLQRNKQVLDEAKASGAESKIYKAEIQVFDRKWNADKIAKEVAPIEVTTELAVGLDFMVRQNLNENLANGTVGKIIKLEKTRIKIKLDDGSEHWVDETDVNLPVGDKGHPVGKFHGLPGHLSHALTPWKGQGLTIRKPVVYHIDRKNRFHGLVYMIATRVETPNNLYIVCEDLGLLNYAVYCEPRVGDFINYAEQVTYQLLGEYEPEPETVIHQQETNVKKAKLFSFDYVQSDASDTTIGHVLSCSGQYFVVCYENGELTTSAMFDNNGEVQWDIPVDASVLSEADEYIRESGYAVAVETSVVETSVVEEVNNYEEDVINLNDLPMWAQDPTNSANVVIAGYSVPVWRHESIIWTLKDENPARTVYASDEVNGYGVLLTDPQAFGESLLNTPEYFEFFKANVKYVWFEDITANQVSTKVTSERPVVEVNNCDLLAQKDVLEADISTVCLWGEKFFSRLKNWLSSNAKDDNLYDWATWSHKRRINSLIANDVHVKWGEFPPLVKALIATYTTSGSAIDPFVYSDVEAISNYPFMELDLDDAFALDGGNYELSATEAKRYIFETVNNNWSDKSVVVSFMRLLAEATKEYNYIDSLIVNNTVPAVPVINYDQLDISLRIIKGWSEAFINNLHQYAEEQVKQGMWADQAECLGNDGHDIMKSLPNSMKRCLELYTWGEEFLFVQSEQVTSLLTSDLEVDYGETYDPLSANDLEVKPNFVERVKSEFNKLTNNSDLGYGCWLEVEGRWEWTEQQGWLEIFTNIAALVESNSTFVEDYLPAAVNKTEEKPKHSVSSERYYAGVGSRETPAEVLVYMERIAFELAKKGFTLRSGGADGADTAFERGCDEANGKKEIFKANYTAKCNSLAAIPPSNPARAQEIVQQVIGANHWNNCSDYAKQLHGRNVCQVLGDDFNTPVEFVVCWTPNGAKVGGTATSIKLAEVNNIYVINLAVKEDFDWVTSELGIQVNVTVPEYKTPAPVIKPEKVVKVTEPVNNKKEIVIKSVAPGTLSDFNPHNHKVFKVPAIAAATYKKAVGEYAMVLWTDIAKCGEMYDLLRPLAEKAARGEEVLITCEPGQEDWVNELIDAIYDLVNRFIK